ncbi:uncharacterized protein LOC141857389 [Brevipalpus obovatus]|uniref:uncharacterized protein LOC141857389 n=1 Tax=Brevipalpus obovatus TaxID=246614 RepID=UPI003D9FA14E
MMAALESNQFMDVDFNSSSSDCSTLIAAENLTPLGSRGDTRDENVSDEEKPLSSIKKLSTGQQTNEWRLEITKKTTNQSAIAIGSEKASEPTTSDDSLPHVPCPIDDRYNNIESGRSPHSILDLLGLRSFYTQICRKFTIPQLYTYPNQGIDSSDSSDSDSEEESDTDAL